MGNCFRCYFGQLFMYLALRKCKINLVPYFCPLKPEIIRFSIGFRLYILGKKVHKRFLKSLNPSFRHDHSFKLPFLCEAFCF